MTNFHVDLTGKNALVTGAGEGIGWAAAMALAKAGASLFVNDLNPDRADRIAVAIQEMGGKAIAWDGDVSNKLLVGPMIEAMRDQLGKIDIVINMAGIDKSQPFLKMDEWEWRRVQDVNLNGTFFVTQLAGRVMADEGGGVIVNLAGLPRPNSAAYAASKAAVIAFTSEAAQELAPHHIRVNAICPAYTDDPEIFDQIAPIILFLCSDAASLIHGQIIYADENR